MALYKIDPIADRRWAEFIERHPASSIFHTPGWLESLRRSYGYDPVVFTTTLPGAPLTDGIAFCQISSWLSGRRLVSLPFSDHCVPLVESSKQLTGMLAELEERVGRENWKYVEIRTASLQLPNEMLDRSKSFVWHRLDLHPSLDEIFQNFQKDCVQRKIRRAEKANLTYEAGGSEAILDKFYQLLQGTRRKHGLPPQPVAWFRNLIACLGEQAKIHVASKDGCPVASILTLAHKRVLVYKYGCSDARASHLGGTQFLFWQAIRQAKNEQFSEFDLGRSEPDNAGLIQFKDRWGAARSTLTYLRFPLRQAAAARSATQGPVVKYLFAHAPDSLLAAAGRILYKHVG